MRVARELMGPALWLVGGVLAFVVLVGSFTGCASPYRVPDEFQNTDKTLVVVTKDTEVRSMFGTNGGADILELCAVPKKVRLFYLEGDFLGCQVLQPTHPLYALFQHKSSRGAGPEIIGGLLVGAGVGASGGASAAANAGASVSNTVIQSVTTGGKKGRR